MSDKRKRVDETYPFIFTMNDGKEETHPVAFEYVSINNESISINHHISWGYFYSLYISIWYSSNELYIATYLSHLEITNYAEEEGDYDLYGVPYNSYTSDITRETYQVKIPVTNKKKVKDRRPTVTHMNDKGRPENRWQRMTRVLKK